jgi:hypothetical protein
MLKLTIKLNISEKGIFVCYKNIGTILNFYKNLQIQSAKINFKCFKKGLVYFCSRSPV